MATEPDSPQQHAGLPTRPPSRWPSSWPRKRQVVIFLLLFASSLVIEKIFEFLTSEATYVAAEKAQTNWVRVLQEASPLSLATGYWHDIGAILSGGDIGWTPAAPPVAPARADAGMTPAPRVRIVSRQCETLYSMMQTDCSRGNTLSVMAQCHDAVAAAKRDYAQSCKAWEAQRQRDTARVRAPPPGTIELPRPDDSEVKGRTLLAPVLAVYRTWTRLTYGGGWSYLWVFLQLGIGLAGALLLYRALSGPPAGPRSTAEKLWRWLFFLPVGTIVMASLLALVLNYLMLGGLFALGGLFGLAGACCGATSVAGWCWFCFHKFVQYSVSEGIEAKAK